MSVLYDMRGFRNVKADGEYIFHQTSDDGKTEVIGVSSLNSYVEYGDEAQYNGVVAHVFFTLLTYNVAAAFRSQRGKELLNSGIRFLRSKMCVYKVFVTAGEYYGIFDIEELMAALGYPPRKSLKFPKAVGF